MLPPLSPTPVPLCVMDIIMGTDHLKGKKKQNMERSFTVWLTQTN